MKRILSCIAGFMLCFYSSYSQDLIQTTVNNDPDTLILETFLSSDCFDVTNMKITTYGDSTQIGLFSNGTASIGVEEGIVFSTGRIEDISSPNVADISPDDNLSTAFPPIDEPDQYVLDILSTLNVAFPYDAVIVEFDFVPTVNSIEFEYVFASEEYCEFVGQQFFDTFGFIISGPGINGPFPNGGENIALIPGTNQEVNINNLNNSFNSQYYVDNTLSSTPRFCNQIMEAAAPDNIGFDGFTTPLKAIANVIPCETYHLTMIITDVNSPTYDSGVFLSANSFKAGQPVNIAAGTNALGDGFNAPYEGCSEPYFTFARANNDLTDSVVVHFTVSAQSTATSGLDFEWLPDSIVIPAGQASFTLPVTIFADDVDEGIEEIILEVENSCSCDFSTIGMFIQDPPPLQASSPDLFACSGVETQIEPIVLGGAPPYSYAWDTDSTTQSITISTTQFNTYTVTITDLCGETAVSEIFVTPFAPTATLDGTGIFCNDQIQADLNVELTGLFGDWELVYSVDGVNDTISNITQNSISLPADTLGVYELVSISQDACLGLANGQVIIENTDLQLTEASTDNSCFNANDGSIQLDVENGTLPYTFNWTNLSNNAIINDTNSGQVVSNLADGSYDVTITDTNGCFSTTSFTITEPDLLESEVTTINHIDCSTIGQGSIDIAVMGGIGPYDYQWSNSADSEDITNLNQGIYSVTILDANDCENILSAEVLADLTPPTVSIMPLDMLDCATNSIPISSSGSSSGTEMVYQWSTPTGGLASMPDAVSALVTEPGFYTLQITDTSNSCTADMSVEVLQDIIAPNAVAGNNATLNCSDTTLFLDGSASSQGNNFSYEWTSLEGNSITNSDLLNPEINQAGFYVLEVTNTQNACTNTDTIQIFQDTEAPFVQLSADDVLDCNTAAVDIDASSSSNGSNFTFEWFNENGEQLPESSLQLSVTQSGTYSLQITNNDNACVNSEVITIFEDFSYPEAEAGSSPTISCSTPSVTLNGTGSSQGNNIVYSWSGGNPLINENSLQPTISEPGIYYLDVSNLDNGCSAIDSVEVLIDQTAPLATLSTSGMLNCAVQELNISAIGSSSGPEFESNWYDPLGNLLPENGTNLDVAEAGIYTLIVTNIDNGCADTSNIEIEQDIILPIVDAGIGSTLTCSQEIFTIDANNSSSGGNYQIQWSTSDGHIVNGANGLQPMVDEAGTYVLEITNTSNQCVANDSVEIFIDQNYPLVDAGSDQTLNCNLSTTSLNATIANTTNYSIEWNTLIGTSQLDNILTPLVNEAGTFELQIENLDNNCTRTDTIQIFEDFEQPTANAGPSLTLNCFAPQQILEAENSSQGVAYSYTWSTNDGIIEGASNVLNPTVSSAGTYELIVSNVLNFCQDTSEVVIAEDFEAPIANAGADSTLNCAITEISIGTAENPNYTYEWTGPLGGILTGANEAQANVQLAGDYQLNVFNTINGCEAEDIVSITIDTLTPVIFISTPPYLSCTIDSVLLDASNSDQGTSFSYNWEGPSASFIEAPNLPSTLVGMAGTYTFTITNTDNYCENSQSIDVHIDTIAPTLIFAEPEELNCITQSVQLQTTGSDVGSNFTYEWTSVDGHPIENPNSNTPNVFLSGDYQLTIHNLTNGCETDGTISISHDTIAPILSLVIPDTLTCGVQTATLIVEVEQVDTPTYQWSTTEGNIINGMDLSEATADAPGWYSILVENPINGCVATASIEVFIDTIAPIALANVAGELNCVVSSLTLDGTGSSAGNFSYTWTGPSGSTIDNANDLLATAYQAGGYQLVVTNNENACQSTASTSIELNDTPPELSLNLSNQLDCNQATASLNATTDQMNNEYLFEWIDANGMTITDGNLASIELTTPGLYQVIVTNPVNECTAQASLELTQDVSPPTAEAGEGSILNCIETTAQLDGTASSIGNNFTYTWSSSDGQVIAGNSSLTPNIQGVGQYNLVVLNIENGCSAQDSVLVTEDIPVAAEIEASSIQCIDDFAQIQIDSVIGGMEPYIFSINGGDSFSNFNSFNQVEAGVYQVIVQDANGCEWAEEIAIEAPNEFNIELDGSARIQLGDDYQLFLQFNIPEEEILSVQWAASNDLSCTDCLFPIAQPTQTSTYEVLVTSIYGCTDLARITIFVDRTPGIYIPNAFSPNNDGANDTFTIYGDTDMIVQIKQLTIFDRWGGVLFKRKGFAINDPNLGWDGKARGQLLNDGVFTYWTEVELIDGTIVPFKGDITIIK